MARGYSEVIFKIFGSYKRERLFVILDKFQTVNKTFVLAHIIASIYNPCSAETAIIFSLIYIFSVTIHAAED